MLLLEHIEYLCLYEAVDFVFYCRIEKRIYDISACRFDVFRLNEIVFVVFLFLAGALVKRNYCDGCTEELVIVFDPGEKHLSVRSDCDFLHIELARAIRFHLLYNSLLRFCKAQCVHGVCFRSDIFSSPFERS